MDSLKYFVNVDDYNNYIISHDLDNNVIVYAHDIEYIGPSGSGLPDFILFDDEHNMYVIKDDGDLLPINHPDLSTQLSILPQRFGKNKIYEILIPVFGTKNPLLNYDQQLIWNSSKTRFEIRAGKVIPSNAIIIYNSLFTREKTFVSDSITYLSDSNNWVFNVKNDYVSKMIDPNIDSWALVQYYVNEKFNPYGYDTYNDYYEYYSDDPGSKYITTDVYKTRECTFLQLNNSSVGIDYMLIHSDHSKVVQQGIGFANRYNDVFKVSSEFFDQLLNMKKIFDNYSDFGCIALFNYFFDGLSYIYDLYTLKLNYYTPGYGPHGEYGPVIYYKSEFENVFSEYINKDKPILSIYMSYTVSGEYPEFDSSYYNNLLSESYSYYYKITTTTSPTIDNPTYANYFPESSYYYTINFYIKSK